MKILPLTLLVIMLLYAVAQLNPLGSAGTPGALLGKVGVRGGAVASAHDRRRFLVAARPDGPPRAPDGPT